MRTMTTTFTRGGRAEETNRLPVDAVFDLLSDERRRRLLYYLIDEACGEAQTADLADHLRSVPAGGDAADRGSIRADLHHRHLPKMETAGLIEYDGRDGAVRYRADPLVEECLARVAARDFDR